MADGAGADVTIASTRFEGNEAPLWIHPNLAGGLSSDLSFEGNDEQRVVLTQSSSSPRIYVRQGADLAGARGALSLRL